MSDEPSFAVIEAIGHINKELSYFYPYTAGHITINTAGFQRKTLQNILQHYHKKGFLITILPAQNKVKISGFMGGL